MNAFLGFLVYAMPPVEHIALLVTNNTSRALYLCVALIVSQP